MMTKNEKIRLVQMLTEKYTVVELHELTTLLKKDTECKVEILPIGVVMPRFTKEDIALNIDAIETAIAITDWDNYKGDIYDTPKEQITDMYWLIDHLNGA